MAKKWKKKNFFPLKKQHFFAENKCQPIAILPKISVFEFQSFCLINLNSCA